MPDERHRQPWDRQAGEGAKAYAAFCRYRDMGPARSVRKAAGVELVSKEGQKGYYHWWRRWSAKWKWGARAAAYDDHVEYVARKQQLEADVAERQADLEEELAQKRLRLQEARAARTAGRQIIQRFLALVEVGELASFQMLRSKNVVVEYGTDGDGKRDGTFVREEIERKGLPEFLGLALQAIVEGQKLERLELGEVTDRTEQQVTEKERNVRELSDAIAEEILNGDGSDDTGDN